MGLFSSSKKTDPAYGQAQQAALGIAGAMGNLKLPDLPSIAAAAPPAVNVPASLPGYLGGGHPISYPVGLPNQLPMIAAQLSAGGYGAPQAIQAQNAGIYRPMTVGAAPPPPPTPPPAPAAAPVVAAPAPAAAPAAASKPAVVAKPLGFTAAQQPIPGPGEYLHTLHQPPMFQTFRSFGDFLNNLGPYRR